MCQWRPGRSAKPAHCQCKKENAKSERGDVHASDCYRPVQVLQFRLRADMVRLHRQKLQNEIASLPEQNEDGALLSEIRRQRNGSYATASESGISSFAGVALGETGPAPGGSSGTRGCLRILANKNKYSSNMFGPVGRLQLFTLKIGSFSCEICSVCRAPNVVSLSSVCFLCLRSSSGRLLVFFVS